MKDSLNVRINPKFLIFVGRSFGLGLTTFLLLLLRQDHLPLAAGANFQDGQDSALRDQRVILSLRSPASRAYAGGLGPKEVKNNGLDCIIVTQLNLVTSS